jgi:hypothetical protein
MTYNFSTPVLPLPIAPTQVPSIADCSDGATTGILPIGVAAFTGLLYAERLNELLAMLSLAALYGGNGHGIVSGLALNTGSTLALAVDAGTAMIGAPIQFAGGSIVVPDDTTYVRIWLKQDGTLAYGTSTSPPTATAMFLGTVTTASGVITVADGSGRVEIKAGTLQRRTADLGAPTDAPPAGMSLVTRTNAGFYRWDGVAHNPVGTPVNTQTLAGNLSLDQYAAPVQALTPSGANRNVTLPSSPGLDQSLRIINKAATGSYNIVVKNPDGSTLLTLTPGQSTPVMFPVVGGANATPKYSTATPTVVTP